VDRKKYGSSPNRVGGKDTRGFSAPRVRPLPGGTESAGTTRIPERLPGFRKAPVPDPLRKTESPLQSGQLHHHLTRTDGRIIASLCSARDGMRPRGPSRLPPRQPTCRRRKIERIHPLDREKIQKYFNPAFHYSNIPGCSLRWWAQRSGNFCGGKKIRGWISRTENKDGNHMKGRH
jgi:hypothetical protein